MNNYHTKLKNLLKEKKYNTALDCLLSIREVDSPNLVDDILFHYFSNEKEYSVKLELGLSEKFPFQFVKAIRTTQVFLDKKRLSYLENFSLDKNLAIHIEIWNKIQKTDDNLWNTIQNNLKKVLDLKIEEVFCEIIFWLENERYSSSNKHKIHNLSNIYNFFIKLYVKHTNQSLQKEKFEEYFFETFFSLITNKTKTNSSISELLNSIRNWLNFNDGILQPYCFDFSIEPKLENGIITFNQEPINYYKWHLDEIRYEKNRTDYGQKAKLLTEKSVNDQKLFISGKTNEDRYANFILASRLKKLEIFLEDLNVLDNKFKGVEKGMFKVFSSILCFSFNRFYRYELNLDKFKEISKNWFQAYFKLCGLSSKQDIDTKPYLLISKKDYIEKVTRSNTQINKKLIQETAPLLFYTVDSKKEFNRFNVDYNVWNKPFIKVGDAFFSPMAFFANNDWFYPTAQFAIKNINKNRHLRKVSATAMENYLGNSFKIKGFKIKVINDKEANNIDGDVDLIIEDNNNRLFIQLKRTYFRLNSKDAYYESIKSDRKATQQLNDYDTFFKKSNDKNYSTKKVSKWIVSTSYEKINTSIEGCNKINYFDLLFTLENKEIQTLKGLINHLEKDKNLLQFYNVNDNDFNEKENLLDIVGLPLKLVDPKEYLQPIFATENYNIEYDNLYEKALSYYQKNNKKAIKLLKNCINQSPNDVHAYGAIGNCYAEVKDLPNLIQSFEKALDIIPNEPYIKRNYALALIENKKYFDGIIMLLELVKDYVFIDDFLLIFITNSNHYSNKLTNKEKEVIKRKYQNISI